MRVVLLTLLSFSTLMAADPQPVNLNDFIAKPAWASAMGRDQYGAWADLTIMRVTQRMRLIPSGTFTMGSPPDEPGHDANEVEHTVILTRSYWLADSPCTQAFWKVVMGSIREHDNDAQYPQGDISWSDCQAFCSNVNQLFGGSYARLPSEAEWEHACRAGTTGPYNGRELDEIAWYFRNANRSLHPVKTKKPNAWGLYDMNGNIWQWCGDIFAPYLDATGIDPTGPDFEIMRTKPIELLRVLRGGNAFRGPVDCRSSARHRERPHVVEDYYGFRLCISTRPGTSP
jgi:formylglycine-generating enzyme required for sulfatase activity